MTASSYLRPVLLLQFNSILAIYTTPTHTLPFQIPLHNTSALTIEQNVQNFVDRVTADPDIRYRESEVVVCYIAVDQGDHNPEHFHDYPLSSNLSEFREIRCIFQYGGPEAQTEDSLFQVENRWPQHWDEWDPPSPGFPFPYRVRPFSWRKAVRYMGAERADRLLKGAGHGGKYALVSMQKTVAHPDGGWCFLNVQITDAEGGGQRTYVVDVRTGGVEERQYCAPYEPREMVMNLSRSFVLLADYR